jgi:hypothetical protein
LIETAEQTTDPILVMISISVNAPVSQRGSIPTCNFDSMHSNPPRHPPL